MKLRILAMIASAITASLCGSACNEKVVVTTSIGLRMILTEPGFNPRFVEAVEIYLASADPARPYSPRPTGPQTVTYNGLPLEVEVKDWLPDPSAADGGLDGGVALLETRLRATGNPFRLQGTTQVFDLVFDTEAARSRPIRIEVHLRKGSRLIAQGSATKSLAGADIVALEGQKTPVQVEIRCALDFSCATGNVAPTLAHIGDQTIAEGQTKVLQLDATDPDGDAVTVEVENAPRFASFDARAGRLTLAPGQADAGVYANVLVRATDSGSPRLSTTERLTITVTNVNRPPAFTLIEGRPPTPPLQFTIDEGQLFKLRLEASDPDDPAGSGLTFSATGLPESATLNARTGSLLWTPGYDTVTSAQGTRSFEVVFSVGDDDRENPLSATIAVTIVVQNVNRPPAFTTDGAPQNQTVAEGNPLTFTIAAVDPDGDPITYRVLWVENAPPSLPDPASAFNPTTGVFSWTPSYADQRSNPYRIRFGADDGFGGVIEKEVTIQVVNTNRPPTVSLIESSPVGALRCTTGQAGLACALAEGQSVSLSVAVGDDPEDAITSLGVSPQPVGSSLVPGADRRTALFTWTAQYDQGGPTPTTLTFTAQDQHGASGSAAVTVSITDVNRPPIVTIEEQGGTRCGRSLPMQCVVPEGESVSLRLVISDDPGEEISLLTLTRPAGTTLETTWAPAVDNRSATFSFSPTHSHGSPVPYDFRFTATDSKSLSTVVNAVVFVSDHNRPPTLALKDKSPTGACVVGTEVTCTIEENARLGFTVEVSDPDLVIDDEITLLSMFASPAAEGASFEIQQQKTSGAFVWTPTYDQGGRSYVLIFSAQDSRGAPAQLTVNVIVVPKNRPPTLTLQSGTVGAQNVCKGSPPRCYVDFGQTLELRFAFSDLDGDPVTLRYESETLPQLGAGFDSARGVFTFLPIESTPQVHQVRFIAKEDKPVGAVETTLEVTIKKQFQNVAPSIVFENCPATVPAGRSATCTIHVDDEDPRDANLSLAVAFGALANFSYNPETRTGILTYVPNFLLSGNWGFYQWDLVATDSHGAAATASYLLEVERSDAAAPVAFLDNRVGAGDMAYLPPYLYVAQGRSLSVYSVPNSSTVTLLRRIGVPGYAFGVRADPVSHLLFVTGTSLKAYDIGVDPGNPALLFLLNSIGGQPDSFAVRTYASGSLAGKTYVYLYGESTTENGWDGIQVFRVGPCEGNPARRCPLRLGFVKVLQNESCSGAVESVSEAALAVTQCNRLRLLSTATELPVLQTGASQLYDLSSGQFDVTRHFGYGPGASGSTILSTVTGNGASLSIFTVSSGLTIAAPTVISLPAGLTAASANRLAGQSVVTYRNNNATSGVSVYSDAGAPVGSVALSGPQTRRLVTGPNIGIATGNNGLGEAKGRTEYLTAVNLSNPASPTKGGELALENHLFGDAASYLTVGGRTYFYVPRPFEGPVEVYDVTDPSAIARQNVLGSPSSGAPQATFEGMLVQGRYLVGRARLKTFGLSTFVRSFAVWDLGVSAVSPPELQPTNFALPATGPQIYQAVGFEGAAGKQYLYLRGNVCTADCGTAGQPKSGIWLVEMTPSGLVLSSTSAVNLGSVPDDFRIAITGTALYTTDTAQPVALKTYNIENPASPVPSGTLNFSASIANLPLIFGSGFLLIGGPPGLAPVSGRLLDATNPFGLVERGTLSFLFGVREAVFAGPTRLWVASPMNVFRYDITDPQHPAITGFIEGGKEETLLHVRGDLLYSGDGDFGWTIYRLLP
jgi:hypothetical protein